MRCQDSKISLRSESFQPTGELNLGVITTPVCGRCQPSQTQASPHDFGISYACPPELSRRDVRQVPIAGVYADPCARSTSLTHLTPATHLSRRDVRAAAVRSTYRESWRALTPLHNPKRTCVRPRRYRPPRRGGETPPESCGAA